MCFPSIFILMFSSEDFNEEICIGNLKHFLPSQGPLKDFIHHNTLHAFQNKPFHQGLTEAAQIFGYKVYLSLEEFQNLFEKREISDVILNQKIDAFNADNLYGIFFTKQQLLNAKSSDNDKPRLGKLRSFWKSNYKIDLDALVHPTLFRIIGSYLDQGVAIWNFPHNTEGLISSIKELEKNSWSSFFRTDEVKSILISGNYSLQSLLYQLVGDQTLFEQYLFDQQFAHPGWSGIVAVLSDNPNALVDRRPVKLEDLIMLELLMELDALIDHFGHVWAPLSVKLTEKPTALFDDVKPSPSQMMQMIWQEAYEWSYYDAVLNGIEQSALEIQKKEHSFQAVFCIDDRECSLRRYIEMDDPDCQTFGTAGFFNVEFFFQPENGKMHTKVCPAPITPKYLIKELKSTKSVQKDIHFGKSSHGLFIGWLLTHTVGFWSAIKLILSVFKPSQNETSVSSFQHMDENSELTIENIDNERTEDGLQVGYTVVEMADRMEGLLRSIGLTDNFAPLIYFVGHGSSSVNNTHYAGYDCGACSGRPGSVNARVIAYIGNHKAVRNILKERGLIIPDSTQFVGALHDTSRDEVKFFDVNVLHEKNSEKHAKNETHYKNALTNNAWERSRRFISVNTQKPKKLVHRDVKKRTVSLFEPRPELNHATNTLCIVGRRSLTDHLFLDRRSFLNSYDCTTDPEGKHLLGILNAVAPVCGGINLEYYFSRTDNQQLGAGTKLPHNVMGLIGVANGADGDLRTGLPSQMIEVHDPLRLLVIVEHEPKVVENTIKINPSTFEWFINEWVRLCAVHPITKEIWVYRKGIFEPYKTTTDRTDSGNNLNEIIQTVHENIPIQIIKN